MSWKRFNPPATVPDERIFVAPQPPGAPYAEAWKEFDKLQKRVRGQGWVRWVIDASVVVLGLWGAGITKRYKLEVIAAWAAAFIFALSRHLAARRAFAEWPCPRCHAVWPETKIEKDPACKVCGLRLHQVSP